MVYNIFAISFVLYNLFTTPFRVNNLFAIPVMLYTTSLQSQSCRTQPVLQSHSCCITCFVMPFVLYNLLCNPMRFACSDGTIERSGYCIFFCRNHFFTDRAPNNCNQPSQWRNYPRSTIVPRTILGDKLLGICVRCFLAVAKYSFIP